MNHIFPKNNYTVNFLLGAILILCGTNSARIHSVNPEWDETVSPEDFFVFFSLFGPQYDIEQNYKVKFLFDDIDMTRHLEVDGNAVVFSPNDEFRNRPDLGGQHKASIITFNRYLDTLESASVSFYILKEGSLAAADISGKGNDKLGVQSSMANQAEWSHTGSFYLNNSYENFYQRELYIGEAGASGNGYRDKWHYSYLVSLTTDESEHEQTKQRVKAVIGHGYRLKAGLGDNTPNFHQFLLNGQRVRGLEIQTRSKKKFFNIDFALGQSKNSVEPFVYSKQELRDAARVPDFNHNDSVNYFNEGTYNRTLGAARIHLGSGNRYNTGITVLKAKDHISSIDQLFIIDSSGTSRKGDSPKDNLALGLDMKVNFLNKKLLFFANGALSMLTDNTENGALSNKELEEITDEPVDLPVDFKNLEWLLVINESTLPLPSPGGLLNSAAYDVGFNYLFPSKSWRNKFEFKFKNLGSNYKSLGNEFLEFNKREFLFTNNLSLYENKLSLRTQYSLNRDNLDELKPEPTWTNNVLVSCNINWGNRLPDASLSYNSRMTENNSPTSSGLDQQSQYQTVGMQMNYNVPIMVTNHLLNLSLNQVTYNLSSSRMVDSDGKKNDMLIETNIINLSVNSDFDDRPYSTQLSFSKNATWGNNTMDYYSIGGGFGFDFIPKKLSANVSYQFDQTKLEAPQRATIYGDNVKLSGRYNMTENHQFNLHGRGNRKNEDLEYKFGLNYEYLY